MKGEIKNIAAEDARFEFLGNRFVDGEIGRLLGITFEQYVGNPGRYDELVEALEMGNGLMMLATGEAVIVELEMARAA